MQVDTEQLIGMIEACHADSKELPGSTAFEVLCRAIPPADEQAARLLETWMGTMVDMWIERNMSGEFVPMGEFMSALATFFAQGVMLGKKVARLEIHA